MKLIYSHGLSRRWLGVGMSLMAALVVQAQTAVQFTVDMVNESPAPTTVYVTGSFPEAGPWSEFSSLTLINVGGTIWSNTFILSDPAGTIEQCKFNDNVTGWEPSANREFILGTTGTIIPGSPPEQILPLATWNAASTWPVPTNSITFRCDMSAQVALGNFVNGGSGQTLLVAGDSFPNQWGSGNYQLTNDPSQTGNASNLYSGTFPVPGFLPINQIQYKFRMNGGWENPTIQPLVGGNRVAAISNATQVLPLVYYSDSSIYDLLLQDTMVTFSLYVTNGTWATNFNITPPLGYQYNPGGGDTIMINGDWAGWDWQLGTPVPQQMVLSDTPNVYTNTQLIPKGHSIQLTYKYGVNGQDDENGFATNHFRLIRTYVNNFALPMDQWSLVVCPVGTAYPNPGIASTNITEPDFGYLKIAGANSDGFFPITWLGRPGVVLLNQSGLTPGSWTQVTGTDSAQSTYSHNAGGSQFFRLMKKQ